MAIRELVTLFTFQVEQTGVNKYKAAIGGLKEMAATAGKLIGITFAAEKIYEFADGLIDAAKEANKVVYQIQRLARSGDDLSNIQDTLLDTALNLHVAYGDVADTFKEMLRESQELGISQEGVLKATENIYKAFRVERLGGTEQKEVLNTLNMVFRRGGLKSERAVNTLYDQSTELMKVLMEAFNQTTVTGMVDLAKKGKLTTDAIVEALSRNNNRLNADFAKAPVKLGQALTDIYSRLTVAAAKLWKLLDNSTAVAKGITWAFNLVVKVIKDVVEWLGGAESAIRLLSIAVGVLIAAKLVPWLYSVAKAMYILRWETWKAMLPWLLWAAAIAAVVLILEDIYVWMRGGRSAIGHFVGPFSEFQQKIEAIIGPFEKWRQNFILFKDTIVEWYKWIDKSFNDSIITVQKWGSDLGKALGIHAFTEKFTTDLNKMGADAKALWLSLPETFSKIGTDIQKAWNDTWTYIGQVYTTWYGTLSSWVKDLKNVFIEAFKSIKESIIGAFDSITTKFNEWKNWIFDGINSLVEKVKYLFSFFSGTPASAAEAVPSSGPNVPAFQPPIPFTTPSVAPGAMAPGITNAPVNDNRQATVHQTNNITVMTQEQQDIADSIKKQMPQLADDMVNKMARELTGGSPRTESATR